MRSDPDALWKPGFTGEVAYPTRAPAPPRVGRPRAWWVIGAIVVAIVVVVIRWRGDDAGATVAEPRLPAMVTPRWSATVPGMVWDLTVSDDVVLAAAHGSEIRLTALAADDGSELWSRRDVDGALAPVGVLGDTALFLSSPTRGADDLVALDVRTGIERWRRPQPTPDSAVFVDEHHLIVTRMAGGGLVGVDLLDPGDGSVRASIDGPGMQINRTEVVTRRGDTFDIYDLDTFERIAHVTVPVLRGAPAAVTVTPHGLVVVTTDRARLVDDDGRVVAGVGLDAAAAPGVSGAFAFEGHVATLVGATLTVLRVDDDGLHTAWSRDADVLHATSGDRPLLALVPAGTYGGAPGRDPIDVVDAATGRAVWSGRVPSPGDGPILTRSGFLAAGSAGVISGIDPSGRTMWTLPTTGSPTIGVGALLEVRPTAGDATSSTVTLLR